MKHKLTIHTKGYSKTNHSLLSKLLFVISVPLLVSLACESSTISAPVDAEVEQPTTGLTEVIIPTLTEPNEVFNPTFTPPTSINIVILDFTETISAGAIAHLRIQVPQGMKCNLSYTTPNDNESSAAGLGPVSSQDGICYWEWKIGINTSLGEGNIYISIDNGEYIILPIIITEP